MRGEVSGLTTWLTPHERDRPSTASLVRPSTAQQRSVDFYGRLNPDPAAATPRHVRQPTFNDSLVDFSMTQQTPFASTFTGPSVARTFTGEFNPKTYYAPSPSVAQRHYLRQLEKQQQEAARMIRPRTVDVASRPPASSMLNGEPTLEQRIKMQNKRASKLETFCKTGGVR